MPLLTDSTYQWQQYIYDVASDKNVWFMHRIKRGIGSNWVGTSGGAEGDMFRTMLDDVKGK